MYCTVMYVCMYVSLHFPFAPQYFPQKQHGFPSVFAKRTSKNIEFFQIFGKRMQEAQASKKSRQGESSLGPLFCDTGSPKTTFSGTSSNCRAVRGGPPPKKKNLRNRRRAGGLSSSKYPTRRAMSADTIIQNAGDTSLKSNIIKGSILIVAHARLSF